MQARFGSTRLPGKVLASLGERTVLAEVLHRCRSIPGIDDVCCAVPEGHRDDDVADEVDHSGVHLVRGSHDDVLARYAKAAIETEADIVMRVTSDCPLIDPYLCGDVLSLRQTENADVAANDFEPAFPHGLDCEVFTADALHRADAAATEMSDREHVAPWIRRELSFRRASLVGPGGEMARQRWTLDWPEDLDFMRELFALGETPLRWQETFGLIKQHPHLDAINQNRFVERVADA
ncbi:MAG: glycosyltransferase family protein [Pseudomonadota bacterium]